MKKSLFITIALLIVALSALAADPDVVRPVENTAEARQTPTPQLDVNQAEMADPPSAVANGKVQLFGGEKADLQPEARPLSPMMLEIKKVVDADLATGQALATRQKAALTENEALRLQRDIELLARETELKILQIQADFARQDGREVIAVEIETAIAQMREPVRRGVPKDRPVPARQN